MKNKTIDFIVDNLKAIRVLSANDLLEFLKESHKFTDKKSRDMFVKLAEVDPKKPKETQIEYYSYVFID